MFSTLRTKLCQEYIIIGVGLSVLYLEGQDLGCAGLIKLLCDQHVGQAKW